MSMNEKECLLRFRALRIAYGPHLAVKGVSGEVLRGEILAIVGPNGAGKTTLLEAVAGTIPIAGGQITFRGERVDRRSVLKRRKLGIVLVPQERNVFPLMTVQENMKMAGMLVSRDDTDRLVACVYDLFPRLQERRRQTANTLSGGERRMLAIGMGIVASGKILLVDEPSIGLAPRLVTGLFHSLEALRAAHGYPIVVSEQNIKVLRIADRILGMEAGERRFCEELREVNKERIHKLYMGLLQSERREGEG